MSETNRRIFLTEEDVPGAKLKQPPNKCTIPELKRWLECHNEKKKGLKDYGVQSGSKIKVFNLI